MAKGKTEYPPISKPKLILVEGKDEELFFSAMIKRIGLAPEMGVRPIHGKNELSVALKALKRDPGHPVLTSVGIIRDADNDADSAFDSVCTALRNAEWPAVPNAPLVSAGNSPQVTVMILPIGKSTGMLEDVCLASVADDPATRCVDQYFQCLNQCLNELPSNLSKARVRTFLVSREVLEESHFEFLQNKLEEWLPTMPEVPSAEKLHIFLASKYKPTLNLGTSAAAQREGEGYWPLDHSAFDAIKEFLRGL